MKLEVKGIAGKIQYKIKWLWIMYLGKHMVLNIVDLSHR